MEGSRSSGGGGGAVRSIPRLARLGRAACRLGTGLLVALAVTVGCGGEGPSSTLRGVFELAEDAEAPFVRTLGLGVEQELSHVSVRLESRAILSPVLAR